MSDEQGPNASPSRRRWRRRFLAAFVAALLLGVAAPYLFSWGPCRRLVLSAIPSRIHGVISAERASLGWFSSPVLEEFAIRTESGEPLIAVESVELEQPLWRLVSHPSDLGRIKAERPQLHLLLREHGSNFEDVFRIPIRLRSAAGHAAKKQPVAEHPVAEARTARVRRKIDLRLVDAAVVWQTPGAKQEWTIDKINLSLGLRPEWTTESGWPEILIERGVVVDHCQLSPGMCDDVLKFVAPILSKVTRAQGEISIDLDDWRIPLGHPEQGELGGRLALHDVEVGPGSFVRSLAELLHVPPNIALARESTVRFELVEGRVRHRDLEFELPGAKVRTSGSVGFDRTLDLLAEVHLQLPKKLTDQSELARSLSEKPLRIPITGTLSQPKLEAGFVRDLGLANLFDKLEGFGLKLPGGAATASGDTAEAGGAAGGSDGKLLTDEAAALLEDLLRKWPERRKARREEAAREAEANAAREEEDGPAVQSKPPARRSALQRLRNRLRRPQDDAEQ